MWSLVGHARSDSASPGPHKPQAQFIANLTPSRLHVQYAVHLMRLPATEGKPFSILARWELPL